MSKKLQSKIIGMLYSVPIILLLLFFYNNKRTKLVELQTLQNSLTAQVEIWKDKDSASYAKLVSLETENTNTFLNLQIADSATKKLQETVKEYKKLLKEKGSVTNTVIHTTMDTTVNTIVIDTNKKFLIYKNDLNTKWYSIKSVATPITTSYTLKVYSDISVIVGQERKNMFSKYVPYVIVTDKNPYSNIKSLKSYQVKAKKRKRFGVGFYGGIGLNGSTTGIPIGLQAGFGVVYTLFWI